MAVEVESLKYVIDWLLLISAVKDLWICLCKRSSPVKTKETKKGTATSPIVPQFRFAIESSYISGKGLIYFVNTQNGQI